MVKTAFPPLSVTILNISSSGVATNNNDTDDNCVGTTYTTYYDDTDADNLGNPDIACGDICSTFSNWAAAS